MGLVGTRALVTAIERLDTDGSSSSNGLLLGCACGTSTNGNVDSRGRGSDSLLDHGNCNSWGRAVTLATVVRVSGGAGRVGLGLGDGQSAGDLGSSSQGGRRLSSGAGSAGSSSSVRGARNGDGLLASGMNSGGSH